MTMLDLDGVTVETRLLTVPGAGASGSVQLHTLVAGPEHGTPVILLHGFPDHALGWRRQIPALARAGYRVIAYDQRGYGRSSKPRGVLPYKARHLADDVVAVQETLGLGPTHVVGHDWGGGVAWALAARRPDRVRTLTIVNCPRPHVLRACLWSNPRQLAKSWYILFFQLPWIPARVLARGVAVNAMRLGARPGTFTAADLAAYAEAATPAAMRAATAWYKAAFWTAADTGPVNVPTMMLWGTADEVLGTELAEASLVDVPDHVLHWLHGAHHHVPHERPDEVNAHLLQHLDAFGGNDPHVYKIVPAATWATAPDPWPGAPIDLQDGYVHLSAASQVAGTLARHFAGQPDLRVLRVDPARLPAGALRWEPSRDGQRFPHLYAPLPRAAVVEERPAP